MRRRPPSVRVLEILLAFWFALTGGEQAAVNLCPAHGNVSLLSEALGVGMGMSGDMRAMSHEQTAAHLAWMAEMAKDAKSHAPGGSTKGHGGHDGHGDCGCVDTGAASVVAAVIATAPTLPVALEVAVAVATPMVDVAGPRAPPAHALPFPTGPPRDSRGTPPIA